MKLIDLINKINYSDVVCNIGDLTLKFNEDKSLWFIENWKNGERHGRSIIFHVNGNLQRIENYKNEIYHGEWKWFDEKGNLESIENWKNGKLIKNR